MSEAKPFPKTAQLARGARRYWRKVATRKQWQAIVEAKGGRCRFGVAACRGRVEMHHLVSRARGGDDVADNIVPLCQFHHAIVTRNMLPMLRGLAFHLTHAEIMYVVDKVGPDGFERLFGVRS